MNVIVVIDGREAIPVRAIPLLTDWETMSPDVVALAFAWDEQIYKSESFNAYQVENGAVKSIATRWWKNFVCVQLDALHHELKRQEASGILSEQEGRRQWRIASLPLLPAGVFIWKDEFEPVHAKRYGVEGLTDLSDKTVDGILPEGEQLRTVKLDYSPFIYDLETQQLVMEGFRSPVVAPDHCTPNFNLPPAPDAAPAQTASPDTLVSDEIDFTVVATRKDLIDAFGKFTNMDMTWFVNLNDTPKLKAARKFTGQGGRRSAEPLFCPYGVMQWLLDPRRRKGKSLSEETAWRLLKMHFGKVYNQCSIGDPNAD